MRTQYTIKIDFLLDNMSSPRHFHAFAKPPVTAGLSSCNFTIFPRQTHALLQCDCAFFFMSKGENIESNRYIEIPIIMLFGINKKSFFFSFSKTKIRSTDLSV